MDCGKSWELMMSQLDGSIERQDLACLENHLRLCPECRKQFDSLQAVLMELDVAMPIAPASTERKVMERICGVGQKEAPPILPYVVLPAAMLTGLLGMLLYNLYMVNPITLVNKAARTLTVFYKVFQSVIAVSQSLFNTLYLREILVVTGFALIGIIIALVSGRLRRAGNSDVYWRATK